MGWEDAKNVKIVTKNFGVADSHKLSVYGSRGGWQAPSTNRRWTASPRFIARMPVSMTPPMPIWRNLKRC